jgi:hypothetical protein
MGKGLNYFLLFEVNMEVEDVENKTHLEIKRPLRDGNKLSEPVDKKYKFKEKEKTTNNTATGTTTTTTVTKVSTTSGRQQVNGFRVKGKDNIFRPPRK